jgi:hypothetical protein
MKGKTLPIPIAAQLNRVTVGKAEIITWPTFWAVHRNGMVWNIFLVELQTGGSNGMRKKPIGHVFLYLRKTYFNV